MLRTLFILVISLLHLLGGQVYAQYIGGDSDGESMAENLTYVADCGLPTDENVAMGGSSDGFSMAENLTYVADCGLPTDENVAIGGSSDGFSMGENLTYVADCGLPTDENVAIGGSSDGFSMAENLTYVADCGLPTDENVAIGGNSDGFSMAENLTYVADCGLPTDENVAIGGSSDGFSMAENLTYVADCGLPVDENVAIGGSSDGFTEGFGGCLVLTPLPVRLLSFDAVLQSDNTVLCEWTTLTEINNDYFTVEKSEDGINFDFVANVSGAGNSNSPLYYKSTDNIPFHGTSYYRLKQTDFDGNFSYSDLKAIHTYELDIISIAPNPAKGLVTVILYSTNEKTVNINFYSMLGEVVIVVHQINVMTGRNELQLNVSSFSKGHYILEIITESGLYRSHHKLIKN